MWKRITRLFGCGKDFKPGPSEPLRLILTEPSLVALKSCLEPEIKQDREGIVYMLGQSDGTTTLVVSIIRPQAQTTWGSFEVSSLAMAQVVRKSVSSGLHVVGQAHTHPVDAYHSKGDEEGARIAYKGYVSIVFPNYGRLLPELDGMAAYMFSHKSNFVPIDRDRIIIVSGEMS